MDSIWTKRIAYGNRDSLKHMGAKSQAEFKMGFQLFGVKI